MLVSDCQYVPQVEDFNSYHTPTKLHLVFGMLLLYRLTTLGPEPMMLTAWHAWDIMFLWQAVCTKGLHQGCRCERLLLKKWTEDRVIYHISQCACTQVVWHSQNCISAQETNETVNCLMQLTANFTHMKAYECIAALTQRTTHNMALKRIPYLGIDSAGVYKFILLPKYCWPDLGYPVAIHRKVAIHSIYTPLCISGQQFLSSV